MALGISVVRYAASEREAEPKAYGTLCVRHGADGTRDCHEVRWCCHARVRVTERWRVGEIQRLAPELEIHPLSDLKSSEEAQVHSEEPRATECVQSHIAETSISNWRKSAGIIKRRADADAARLFDVPSNLISHLRVLWSVQRGAIRGNDEWCARV